MLNQIKQTTQCERRTCLIWPCREVRGPLLNQHFIEFLTRTLTIVLSSPILTHCSQEISCELKALSIALKRLSGVEQCSPDVVHMLKYFTSILFDLSISKMWMHMLFIFSRLLSLDPSLKITMCVIQDTSRFRSVASETLCNFWVRKHLFM